MEIRDIAKGWQIRSRKATGLLTAFDLGKIVTSEDVPAEYLLPTMAHLGESSTATHDLVMSFQRGGVGTWRVFVEPGVNVNWNNINPLTLPVGHPPVVLLSRGVDTWDAS
jgi:hypothetical protein